MTVSELFSAAGAAAFGSCAFNDIPMDAAARTKALELVPGARGVYVAAFPYYNGKKQGNLSFYARGEDYHRAILRRLSGVTAALETLYPHYRFVAGTDASPLPERVCAKLAGVGILGQNGLVIVPPYGSYVFLGTVLTDLPLASAPTQAPSCIGCGACLRACPGGALRETPFEERRCLSALTQKKGVLSPEEQQLLQAHPLIWGCDICQTVCPYNQSVIPSPLDDLSGRGAVPYLADLHPSMLDGLTNRTFQHTFGDRAFAWRGPAVLRRNLHLKEKY